MALLRVRELSIDLILHRSARRIVSNVSFDMEAGTTCGLFGESGCGKTTLALSLLNLLPRDRYRITGSVNLNGREMLLLPERELERVRGAQVSMVFQDPLMALNPVMRVGDQITEVFRAHDAAREGLADLLRLVGLPEVARISASYPHQLSGGERQRAAIAQSLACRPSFVIADEPFTALDSIRVMELVALFRQLRTTLGTSFLIISHSPGVLAHVAETVMVMRDGSIVEQGSPQQVFHNPSHPYTAGLLGSLPHFHRPTEGPLNAP